MSNLTKSVIFKCENDCVASGCPKHILTLIQHQTSDTYTLKIDGEYALGYDAGYLKSLVRLAGMFEELK